MDDEQFMILRLLARRTPLSAISSAVQRKLIEQGLAEEVGGVLALTQAGEERLHAEQRRRSGTRGEPNG